MTKNTTDNIRKVLIQKREEAGLSQRQLAERMGTHQSNICRIEREGVSSITIGLIDRWLEACGLTYEISIINNPDSPYVT